MKIIPGLGQETDWAHCTGPTAHKRYKFTLSVSHFFRLGEKCIHQNVHCHTGLTHPSFDIRALWCSVQIDSVGFHILKPMTDER